MKYPKLDLGRIEAIVNKMGGMQGVQQFLAGEQKLVKDFTYPWKTISVRDIELNEIIEEVERKCTGTLFTTDRGENTLADTTLSLIEDKWFPMNSEEVKFVRVTPYDLGFNSSENIGLLELLDRVTKKGLLSCEVSEVLEFVSQYKGDRKNSERYHFITNSMAAFTLTYQAREDSYQLCDELLKSNYSGQIFVFKMTR